MPRFLAAQYHTDFEESVAVAPEKVASFYMPAVDLQGETSWDLADLTTGLELGSHTNICW